MRPSGRAPDEMRAITIEPNFTRHAEGSVLIGFGDTKVLVTASIEERIPPWLRGKGEGWVTAEYGMLPRATHTRGQREAAKGKQSGRTQEIQRLIGRSLRAVTDLKLLGERRLYPSPVYRDLDGDGLEDLVVGDLRDRLTVAHRAPGDGPAKYGAEKPVLAVDGKEIDFHNW